MFVGATLAVAQPDGKADNMLAVCYVYWSNPYGDPNHVMIFTAKSTNTANKTP